MKATQTKKPIGTAESKNEPGDREQAVLHEQVGEHPRRARRSFWITDDDWSRLQRRRGRLKDELLTAGDILEAWERTDPKKPEAVAESKYEATDYERAVLAKQAQRLKDQVRVPRMKLVEYQRGWFEFDHPDQSIAFVLLKEAFGTADDNFAKGLLHHVCAVLPIDESSARELPRAADLNRAISLIAAGKPVDELHAELLADSAVCRIIAEQLLHNVREPLRFDLAPELKLQLLSYRSNPKGEVKIDNWPVLEFSFRYAIRLMTLSIQLLAAADQHRAIVESSRKMQQLSAVTPVEANVREIKYITANAPPKKSKMARGRRLKNGSTVTKLFRKTSSTTVRKANGHTPT